MSQEPKTKPTKKKQTLSEWKQKLQSARKKQLLYKKKAVQLKDKLEAAKNEHSEVLLFYWDGDNCNEKTAH